MTNKNLVDNEKCVYYNVFHSYTSSGIDMKKSVARKGDKANAYKCSICSGEQQHGCSSFVTASGRLEDRIAREKQSLDRIKGYLLNYGGSF